MGRISVPHTEEKDGGPCSKTSAAISPLIPVFSYEAANFKRQRESVILVGDKVIHPIADDSEFHRALGFKALNNRNLVFEEYLWDRYKRDGAERTAHCMQVQLNAYLFRHSATYMQLYGDIYTQLINDDSFACISEIRAICDNCSLLQPQMNL